jgi:hypothetical protein
MFPSNYFFGRLLRKGNVDLSPAGSRLLNESDNVTVRVSYACDQPSATDILYILCELELGIC